MISSDKRISAADLMLQYTGRIDFENPEAPVFVFPCSSVRVVFRGTAIRAVITNMHSYYENSIGVILDGKHQKIILPDEGQAEITLGENLPDAVHDVLLYKRMDACHYFTLAGFILPQSAELLEPPKKPSRRIEVYGDSVSAGEVSEAVEYCGKPDPVHNGVYSDSWYSYSWIAARKLNAQIHDIAQGGAALLDGTGYFCGPDYLGMETIYNKIQYNPYISPMKDWEFSNYHPNVVIVAIGQNDNHPVDCMEASEDSPAAVTWKTHYRDFVINLRRIYPAATIILSTTILNHDAVWDNAIENICREMNDSRIHHFLYSNNGCGTPGHIRIPEAEKMAEELCAFIDSLGEGIWEEE